MLPLMPLFSGCLSSLLIFYFRVAQQKRFTHTREAFIAMLFALLYMQFECQNSIIFNNFFYPDISNSYKSDIFRMEKNSCLKNVNFVNILSLFVYIRTKFNNLLVKTSVPSLIRYTGTIFFLT